MLWMKMQYTQYEIVRKSLKIGDSTHIITKITATCIASFSEKKVIIWAIICQAFALVGINLRHNRFGISSYKPFFLSHANFVSGTILVWHLDSRN